MTKGRVNVRSRRNCNMAETLHYLIFYVICLFSLSCVQTKKSLTHTLELIIKLTLQTWRWRQNVPSKRRHPPTELYSVTPQTTTIWTLTAVNLGSYEHILVGNLKNKRHRYLINQCAASSVLTEQKQARAIRRADEKQWAERCTAVSFCPMHVFRVILWVSIP
jgi:hypothetical protein